jgi:CelD/BcsL family acetyltransferase involved in cellulose biosynthesis
MTSAHTLTSEDLRRWKNLPTESCTFFQTYIWNQFLSEAYSYPDYSATVEPKNGDNGFLPLKLVKSNLFGTRLISTPFSDYAGPTETNIDNQKLLLKAALEKHKRLKTDFLEVRLSRRNSSKLYAVLNQLGLKQIHEYSSFLIDLKEGQKSTWSRITQSTRRAIRKTEQEGIEVREAKYASDIQSYHQLHVAGSREHGSPAHPLQFFTEMHARLSPEGQMKLLLASHKQHDVAGLLLLRHRPTVHYWQSALPSKYRTLNPFHELLWKALTYTIEEGFTGFDMGRTRSGTGVYRFKRSWGGMEYQLDHYCFFAAKTPKLADPEDLKFKAASAVWKRIPQTILNRVDPRIIREIAL